MKQLITIIGLIALLCISQCCFAQTHLPKTVTVTLTDKQLLKIDSAITKTANGIDSKSYSAWFLSAFQPLYDQARAQMVTDSVRKVQPK